MQSRTNLGWIHFYYTMLTDPKRCSFVDGQLSQVLRGAIRPTTDNISYYEVGTWLPCPPRSFKSSRSTCKTYRTGQQWKVYLRQGICQDKLWKCSKSQHHDVFINDVTLPAWEKERIYIHKRMELKKGKNKLRAKNVYFTGTYIHILNVWGLRNCHPTLRNEKS